MFIKTSMYCSASYWIGRVPDKDGLALLKSENKHISRRLIKKAYLKIRRMKVIPPKVRI